LTIVGAGDGSWLQPYLGLPKLRFLGRVPELASHYQAACASLVPIFFGSGTRVKAIEAGSYARPCISTEIGVEGIGLDPAASYLRAETREQWLQVICGLELEDARRRGQAAYARISESFDPAKVAGRFLRDLEASI
jgi:glycosyltransferase involved in cell wall biosynthesis